MSSGGSWLQFGNTMNKFKSTYMNGFLDICGNLVVREGNMTMLHGDISCNGELHVNRIRDSEGNVIVSSGGGGTVIDDSSILTIDSLTTLNATNATNVLTGNVGIGKAATSYALDVSGSAYITENLISAGTLQSLGANASIGKVIDTNYNLDVNGSIKASDNAYINSSLIIDPNASITTDISNAAIFVKATRTDTSHNVVFDAPNTVMRATDASDITRTNHLIFDTTNRKILPFVRDSNGDNVDVSGSTSDGWELGGPGPNRFDKIYARDVKISTNTLLIEDDDGNLIGMSFNAATGAVNYNVTTAGGEQFTIKGVQTQKISSGAGTIDPSLLEFTGLSFGDTFDSGASADLSTTYTYNLSTTTYLPDSATSFAPSVAPQNFEQFLTPAAKDALLGSLETGNSAVIRVGTDSGRLADNFLDPFETSSSQIDLTNKIITVKKKTASVLEWSLWSDETTLYNNIAGNYLNYIELKNINMASGTYFVAKTSGNLEYNINDPDFLTTADLTGVVNGDLFLYVARGLGKNWTKIPVSLPQAGSIDTQHLAVGSVKETRISIGAVTEDKLAAGSVTASKIGSGQVNASHIQAGAISANSFADGSISGAKITNGTVTLNKLEATVLNDKQNTLTAGDNINIIGSTISAVVNTVIADASITASKLADNAVGASKIAANAVTGSKILNGSILHGHLDSDSVITVKIADGNITNAKLANSSVYTLNLNDSAVTTLKMADGNVTTLKLAANAVTTAKILDNNITSSKLHIDTVDSFLSAGANITLTKNASGVVSIASSGGGGGGGGGVTLTSTTDIIVRNIDMHGDLSGNDASFNTIEFNKLIGGMGYSGHIIPDTDNAYDIGSAEYKIRDLYVSDNSIWIGDDNKLGIDEEGVVKFRKRKKSVVPSGITGGNLDDAKNFMAGLGITRNTANEFKLSDWKRYAKSKGHSGNVNDIYLAADVEDSVSGVLRQWTP